MIQKQTCKSRWVLAAAVAAVPVLGAASSASAQFRQENRGRALDANPRVGSNGSNDDGGRQRGPGVTGNQIVNRNVTAGREFRGAVPYSDAREFRGVNTGAESDRFIRNSVGVPTRTQQNLSNYEPVPFYGDSRGVAPPPGAVPLGPSGGYTTVRPGTVTRDQLQNSPFQYNAFGSGLTGDQPPQLGTTLMRGPTVDPQGRQGSLIAASPLAGIQQLTPQEAQDVYMKRLLGDTRAGGADRFGGDVSGMSIRELQNELSQTLQTGQANPQAPREPGAAAGQPQGADTNAGGQPGQGQNGQQRPLGQPLEAREAPGDPRLRSSLRGTAIESDRLGAGVGTGESTRRQVTIPPPDQQSTAYRQMRERFQAHRAADQEAQSQFEYDLRHAGRHPAAPPALKNAPGVPGAPAAPGAPGAVTPGAGARPVPAARPPAPGRAPAAPRIPGAAPGTTRPAAAPPRAGLPAPRVPGAAPAARPTAPAAPRANLGKPVQVKSLAAGVTARGLAELLRSAEQLMQEKKFGDALAAYDRAEQVVPNNPLIVLGRAHAAMGAATYRNAEADLREAFVRDPALLHAQYDLKAFLGEEHLQTVINDLRDIAKREPSFVTPAFLLAYISYNTGNEAQAVTYLNEVEKRLGRPDPVVKLLRTHWTLPPAGAPEANK